MWFNHYCNIEKRVKHGTLGLVDVIHVQHNPFGFPSTHVGEDTRLQVANWLEYKKVQLTETWNSEEVYEPMYYYPELNNDNE